MARLEHQISSSAEFLVDHAAFGPFGTKRLSGDELTDILRLTFPNANEATIKAGLDLYLTQSLNQFRSQDSTVRKKYLARAKLLV